MKLKQLITVAMVVGAAWGAMAMPSIAAREKAQPLVKELMQDDLTALKDGKKTPVEVGDASMKYAAEAKSEAEKFLLYKGAVYYYARGGNGEKAAEAVEALRAGIAEVPPEVVVDIISASAKGMTAKQAPRLMAIYKVVRAQVAAQKSIPAAKRELEKNPDDKKGLRKLAELQAIAGDWTAARENFANCGGKAAQAVKDEADGKVKTAGDFWWDYEPAEKDEGEVFKRHAAALYQIGLDNGVFDGLGKRVVEKRVKQYGDVEVGGKGAVVAKGRKVGETKTVALPGGAKLELVWCPSCPQGFMMGSPADESGRRDNEKQHLVKLTRGFWIGKYQVTQEQWQSVMGNNPALHKGANRPVDKVSWEDSQEFCKKACAGLRLPTEAEWEYACRAGTTGAFAGDIDKMSWYQKNSSMTSHPVGGKDPNAWGIYDMHGNIWEWCQDWLGDYPDGEVTDPVGPETGKERVLRGGCWGSGTRACRSASHGGASPTDQGSVRGLRVAMSEESAR